MMMLFCLFVLVILILAFYEAIHNIMILHCYIFITHSRYLRRTAIRRNKLDCLRTYDICSKYIINISLKYHLELNLVILRFIIDLGYNSVFTYQKLCFSSRLNSNIYSMHNPLENSNFILVQRN